MLEITILEVSMMIAFPIKARFSLLCPKTVELIRLLCGYLPCKMVFIPQSSLDIGSVSCWGPSFPLSAL